MREPARLQFTPKDERLAGAICPFNCGVPLRVVYYHTHPWGERIIGQCDACGAIVEIHDNVERMRFEVDTLKDEWSPKLTKCCEKEWAAGNIGHKFDAEAAAKEAHKLDLERRTRTCATEDCKTPDGKRTEFVPKLGARSEATRRYCAKCRKEIPKDDIRWMDDVKRAKLDEASKIRKPRKKK